MKTKNLCIIIPAKNEEYTITETIDEIYNILKTRISFSVLVVNDYSVDNTIEVIDVLSNKYNTLSYVNNTGNKGVGNAIKFGISISNGDIIAICMADGSDSPEDIFKSYYYITNEKYDCVFGSRFINKGSIKNYPFIKKALNRLFNNFVKIVSTYKYNDFTNIFKVYRKSIINEISPLEAGGFSIGLEMSLKCFKKNAKVKIIPITWSQRKAGKSKLNIVKNIKSHFRTLIILLRDEA